MDGGLYMLGASTAGLAAQNIVVHVVRVDGDVLKRKMAELGKSAAIAPAAVFAIEQAPKLLIDAAIPFMTKALQEYGVTAEIKATETVPPARNKSEFVPGFIVGGGVTAVAFGIGWATWALLLKRLFT